MKVLLVNPPTRNYHVPENPMLGILYLASVIREKHDAWVLDFDALRYSWKDIKNRLVKENPDVIGITSTTYSYPNLLKICSTVKKNLPETKIIIGGPHVSAMPDKSLQQSKADFVVVGEGEIAFNEILESITNNKKIQSRIVNGKKHSNLDKIPIPSRDLLEPVITEYLGNAPRHEMPETVMIWSRGCPHNCFFCSNPIYKKQSPRFRSAKNIVKEIKELKRIGIKEIFVYDDELVGMSKQQNKWLEDVCKLIIKERINMSFKCQGRCSPFLDKKTLVLMKKAGFKTIMWGCESGSDKVLKTIRKGITSDDIKRAVRICKESRIEAWMFLMIGNHNETFLDVKKTLQLVRECRPDHVQVTYATPYPGEFYDLCVKNNLLLEKDTSKWNTNIPVVKSRSLRTGQMIKMRSIIENELCQNEKNKKINKNGSKAVSFLLSKNIPFRQPLQAVYNHYVHNGWKSTVKKIGAHVFNGGST